MKWILILIAAASAFAAGFFINSKPANGASQAAAGIVAQGAVTGSLVAAAGRVEPVSEEIRMGAEVNGKLREVLVDEGDRIRRGQVLAIIENADYSARVASAEAVFQSRDAAVRKLENGSRPEERLEAEASLAEARAVLENANADVLRRRELFRSGDIAKSDLDRYEREISVAQARLNASRQRFELVDRSTREEDLSSARAEAARARAEVSQAKALLAKTVLRAPLTGVVLRRHHRTGETVSDQFDDPVFTLGDDSSLRVRVDVDEADVARVKVGQSAYVTAEAFGKTRFAGRVVRIGQLLGRNNIRTDEPTERVDKKILETLIALDAGKRLPNGLRVDAWIQVQ